MEEALKGLSEKLLSCHGHRLLLLWKPSRTDTGGRGEMKRDGTQSRKKRRWSGGDRDMRWNIRKDISELTIKLHFSVITTGVTETEAGAARGSPTLCQGRSVACGAFGYKASVS